MEYRGIVSGERGDLAARVMRGGLWAASKPYAAYMRLRNRQFDGGSREVHRCGVPVISIGNLTTGGTGKTPIVCGLAKRLRAVELRVAIVSRGYGRGQADHNDEAEELFARLPDVPHVQDPDRVEAARIAVEELECEVILMDDGFQHRRLHRDLNLLVIDATCPFGYGHTLPRGLLREPITGLRRADLIVLSRCDQVTGQELARTRDRIAAAMEPRPHVPVIESRQVPKSLLTFPHSEQPIAKIADGLPVALVSAIGNPEAFERTVAGCGAKVVGTYQLADHAAFDRAAVEAISRWLGELSQRPQMVLCTHKDLVKLQTDRLAGSPLAALLIDWQVTTGEEDLQAALDRIGRDAKNR